MKSSLIVFSVLLLLSSARLFAQNEPEYANFYTGKAGPSTKGIDWVQAITVSSPAYGSDIKGDVTVHFKAPGMTWVEARCWQQPTTEDSSNWGHDVVVAHSIPLQAGGEGSFVFPAGQFPHGPITLRIYAKGDGKKQHTFARFFHQVIRPRQVLVPLFFVEPVK